MGRGSIWMPLAATACVLGLGGTAWVTRDQAEVRERLARFVAEHDQWRSSHRREAVYGETLEGNACDDYVAASKEIAPLRLRWRVAPDDPSRRRTELTEQGCPLTEETRRTMQPALDRALQSIGLGVRRACALRKGVNVAILELQVIVDDAIDRAFAAHDGRRLAELFLDRWVLQGDLWGRWINAPAFRDEWLHALDAGSAAWFGEALCRVDERMPIFASARDHIANCVREAADRTPLQQSFTMGLSAWRYGFDWFWRDLVFCDRLLVNLHELEPPVQDWLQRQAQLAAFDRVIDSGRDAWAARIAARMRGEERLLRTVRTDLRLLRLAVAFAHGLEMPHLADPLGGGAIEVELRGDDATFRSEGMEGKRRLERTVRRR